jgi:hypothetical protein
MSGGASESNGALRDGLIGTEPPLPMPAERPLPPPASLPSSLLEIVLKSHAIPPRQAMLRQNQYLEEALGAS